MVRLQKPSFSILVVVLLAVAACASKDVAKSEIAAAESAVAQAQQANAGKASPTFMSRAQERLARAKIQAKDGDEDEAKLSAEQARADANAALAEAERQRARANARKAQSQRQRARSNAAVAAATEAEAKANAARAESQARRAAMAEAEARRKAQELEMARASNAELNAKLSDLEAKQSKRGSVITLGDVLFETDRANLTPAGLQKVREIASYLQLDPGQTVVIEGHADSTGASTYNLALSRNRAEFVRRALLESGIPQGQIISVGVGESALVASNLTSAGRQMNRRVEVILPPRG